MRGEGVVLYENWQIRKNNKVWFGLAAINTGLGGKQRCQTGARERCVKTTIIIYIQYHTAKDTWTIQW